MKISLKSQGHRYYRELSEPLRVNVDLVLISVHPHDTDEMSAALERIERLLCGGIDLVTSDPDKPRCFYCGSLNDKDANMCSQCGASL